MCEHKRKDKIQNDCMQGVIGAASIEKNMTKIRLRWFGHVQRKSREAPVRRLDCMNYSPMKKRRGRPRRTLENLVKGISW